ncbi:hypothetical protein [Sulfuriferula nivalis]|uniref:Uncharacterized protein n=1 Tax=Sulfuriferula nivalis TaxID=2675298 RepID=A0A809S0R6_9PROT|nr:hypothetical protein [Sulfuriferula nivalis]BBP00098.1 hypothetical protein SFSGTM_08060 [Sulfuriferula nivalis]
MKHIPKLTLLILILILMPGIGCFEYYTDQAVDNKNSQTRWLILLAYPFALAALIGLVQNLIRQPRNTKLIRLFTLLFLIPTILLLVVRGH